MTMVPRIPNHPNPPYMIPGPDIKRSRVSRCIASSLGPDGHPSSAVLHGTCTVACTRAHTRPALLPYVYVCYGGAVHMFVGAF
jgi:hypothetical protein